MNYTKDQIYEVFKKHVLAKDRVVIAGFPFNTTYNYEIPEKNESVVLKDYIPTIQIKNEEELKELLYEYCKTYVNSNRKFTKIEQLDEMLGVERNKLTYALTSLFFNVSFDDFKNINNYVKRSLDFLNSNIGFEHNYWHNLGEMQGVKNANILFRIAQSNYSVETPDRLEVKIERVSTFGEEEVVYLPAVCFGISGKNAYVYTLQNLFAKNNNSEKLEKEVNRARFKLNSSIKADEQDAEPLNIISATILTGFLKSQQVDKIYVNNFLPIRYFAKSEAIVIKAGNNQLKLAELMESQLHIQNNLTTKFSRTFMRVEQQAGAISMYSDIMPEQIIFKNSTTTPEVPNPFLIQLHENAYQSVNLTKEK